MVTHDLTKLAHKTVTVVSKNWNYNGQEVEVSITNTSPTTPVTLGNAGRYLALALIQLVPPPGEDVGQVCEKAAGLLAQHGIDLNKLCELYNDLVAGTEGCPRRVLLTALQGAMRVFRGEEEMVLGDEFLFDLFLKEALWLHIDVQSNVALWCGC